MVGINAAGSTEAANEAIWLRQLMHDLKQDVSQLASLLLSRRAINGEEPSMSIKATRKTSTYLITSLGNVSPTTLASSGPSP